MRFGLRAAVVASLFAFVVNCGDPGPADQTFKIDLVKYLDNSYTTSFQESLVSGLEEAGVVKERDYSLRSRSAQGDMSNLTLLVDAAVADGVNLLITFQSPTLYTAIQRAPSVPKVFTLLQNPFLAGAGTSDDDHLAHLTGLYLVPPFEELTMAVAGAMPPIKTLGTVFFAGNYDSVYRKEELVRIAKERDLEVIAEPYTSIDEISPAVDLLLTKQPQAVVHLQDPAQDTTFPVLYKGAAARKVPVLSVVYNMEKVGASLVVSTDRDEIGRRFAAMVGRIIKGGEPSNMPFESDRDLPKRIGYNTTAATAAGFTIPRAVLDQLDSMK